MADETPPAALDRIDRAIARIETALAQHLHAGEAIALRHAALRTRMQEAVEALDRLMAQGDDD